MGGKGSLQGEEKGTGALLPVCLPLLPRVRVHTQTHTHQPREGGRAGLRSRGGRARKGETKEVGGHARTDSSSPAPFLTVQGLQLGLEGRGPAEPHLAGPSLTEGRKGAAGAASMLYCLPPGTLFLLERPKWYSGGEKRAGRDVGGGHCSPGSTLAPAHLPPPSAPQLQPHLPPGKQQEEQRRLRGWRREGGGKEPEPEPPEGDGVGGLRPMTGVGDGSQQRGMAESISKTPGIKDTEEPRNLGSWCPHPQEGVS